MFQESYVIGLQPEYGQHVKSWLILQMKKFNYPHDVKNNVVWRAVIYNDACFLKRLCLSLLRFSSLLSNFYKKKRLYIVVNRAE